MANCRWKMGCIVYWGVVICSTVFLVVLHFQGQYVLPTDAYLSCEYLLKANFAIIIIFTMIAVAFTKSKVKDGVMPVLIFTMAVGLLLLSIYTLFLLETVVYPNVKDAIEFVRKRYAADGQVLAYIQLKNKCCGIQNYTDWYYILRNNSEHRSVMKEGGDQIPEKTNLNVPLVPSSCCKLYNHCEVHLRGHLLEKTNHSHSKQSTTNMNSSYLQGQLYTLGCYKNLKIHSQNVYEAMRMYACTAFVFVSFVTLVFSYYWWRSRVETPEPKGWPAPPMNVKSIFYDPQRRNIIAYIDPFMDLVLGQDDTENEL